MSLDQDIYNEPTEPQRRIPSASSVPQAPTVEQVVSPAPASTSEGAAPKGRRMSRRAMVGASIAGLAGLSIGGVVLEQWVQHGGLNSLFHSTVDSRQIGHLLRR